MEEAHEDSRWSMWSLMVSLEFTTTPRTLMVATFSAPLINGSGWSKVTDERLLSIPLSLLRWALDYWGQPIARCFQILPQRWIYMSRAHHQVRIICIFHHLVVLMYGAEARGNDDIWGGTDDGPLDYACVNKRDLGYYVPQQRSWISWRPDALSF